MQKGRERSQFMFVATLIAFSVGICSAQAPPPLKLIQTIPMPQIKCQNPDQSKEQLTQSVDTEFMPVMTCHFDRFGVDLKNNRLFVVAENDGTIEIYSMSSGKLLHSLGGFAMPTTWCTAPT
jgi:hypothetical protein